MKIFKILLWILMVAALAGGVYLVRMNQENRGKATSTVPELLFNSEKIATITKAVGETFYVNVAIDMPTGKGISVFEFGLTFDKSKLQIAEAVPNWWDESKGNQNTFNREVSFFKHLNSDDKDDSTKPSDSMGKREIKNDEGTALLSGFSTRIIEGDVAKGIVQTYRIKMMVKASGQSVVAMKTTGNYVAVDAEGRVDMDNASTLTVTTTGVDTCSGSERKCVGGIPTWCNVDGRWETKTACTTGNECRNGVCVNTSSTCTTNGEKKCVSTTKKAVCTDGNWVETACGANETCDVNTKLCVATETAVCTAGAKKCVSGVPNLCVSNAWQAQTACGSGKECKDGSCADVVVDTTSLYLNFRTTLLGVTTGGKCATGLKAKVVVKNGIGASIVYTDVPLVRNGEIDTTAVFNASIKMTSWTSKDDLLVFVKGIKHMQMKYGEDLQSGIYNGTVGKISVSEGTGSKVYDFTKYPLMPGDIDQDGKINGEDFSLLKSKVSTHETFADGTYRVEDLNGDCQYNSLDIVLLVKSLDTKQDEIY